MLLMFSCSRKSHTQKSLSFLFDVSCFHVLGSSCVRSSFPFLSNVMCFHTTYKALVHEALFHLPLIICVFTIYKIIMCKVQNKFIIQFLFLVSLVILIYFPCTNVISYLHLFCKFRSLNLNINLKQ